MSVRLPVFGKLPLWVVIGLTTTTFSASAVGLVLGATTSQIENETHRQSQVIKPEGQLKTFCLNGSGEILAVCSTGAEAELEIFNAAGDRLRSIHIPFAATAVNVSPEGKIFVAGNGRMARLSSNGELEVNVETPNLGNEEELMQKAAEGAKRQAEEIEKVYQRQLELLRERIAEIEKKAEKLTKVEKLRRDAYQRQIENYQKIIEQLSRQFDAKSILGQAKRVTSLAVNSQDVFVCCGNLQGAGYVVWRTDHDFANPKELMQGLRGCCGQMDIQCCGENLVVARNTSFSVGFYNRDGEELSSFGKGDRSSVDGFGSCCNPMNVRPLADGSILTAESSIGHIKQFKQDGTFVGYVGKAKIGGGCKHCAMGYDPKSDQYYMMSQDAGHIAVLVPRASLPNGSDADQLAARLKDEFASQLLGTWQLGKPQQAKKKTKGVLAFLGSLFGAEEEATDALDVTYNQTVSEENPPFQSVTFHADGTLKVSGGPYQAYGQQWKWSPTKGANGTLEVSLEADQAELLTMSISFTEANQAKFRVKFYGNEGAVSGKRTLTCEGKPCDEACQENNDTTKQLTKVQP